MNASVYRQPLIVLLTIAMLLKLSVFGSTEPMGDSTRSRILIVKSRDVSFYNTVVEGFIAGLKTRGYRVKDRIELKTVALSGKPDVDAKLVQDQLGTKPTLIVTMGTDATRLVADQKPTAPVLFNMVLDPVCLSLVKSLDNPGANFTGTTLMVNPGKQLDTLLQTAPNVHRIGLLYSEDDSTSLVFLREARIEAQRLKIDIEAIAQKEGQSATQGLKQFTTPPDALWLIPDPASTGAEAFTATLEYAKQRHLPVLGSSSSSVQAGALLALSANLQDLGGSAAEMAAGILSGSESPATMRVRPPRRLVLSINLVTAREQKINIPGAVLHLADEVVDTEREDKNQ